MHYILFMMLLITPPGQSQPKEERLYTLQTTQAIEFTSLDACSAAHDEIKRSVRQTDTIVMVSSCLAKGAEQSQVSEEAKPDKGIAGGPTVPPTDGAKPNAVPTPVQRLPNAVHFDTFDTRKRRAPTR